MRESRFWLSILLHTYEPHNPCALANGYVPWWLPGCNSANAETTEPPTTNHEPPWPSPALKCGYTNAHLSSSLCVWVRACAWGFLMNQHSWTPSCKPTKNIIKKIESKFEKKRETTKTKSKQAHNHLRPCSLLAAILVLKTKIAQPFACCKLWVLFVGAS